MTRDIEERFEHLDARFRALANLMLSHIVVSNIFIEGLAQGTVEHATVQRDAALRSDQGLAAVYLNGLLDQIRTVCDLPLED